MRADRVAALGRRPDFAGELRLILPPRIDLIAGLTAQIWFEQIAIATSFVPGNQTFPGYTWAIVGPGSIVDGTHWEWAPTDSDVGPKVLTIRVSFGGAMVGQMSTRIMVYPSVVPVVQSIDFSLCGDSILECPALLGHVGTDQIPNTITRALTTSGVTWRALGGRRTRVSDPSVYCEAHSGRSWSWFGGNYIDPVPDPSPFASGFAEWVWRPAPTPGADTDPWGDTDTTGCDGVTPAVVMFQLGTNDSYSASGDIDAALAPFIAGAVDCVADVLAGIPGVRVGVSLQVGLNGRDSSTPTQADHWQLRVNRHRWNELMLAQFGGREAERIYILPQLACLDPFAGFFDAPVNDELHPNPAGMIQLGQSWAGFIRRMAAEGATVAPLAAP